MINIKNYTFLVWITFLLHTYLSFANDGAYYASGNHLVPITNENIAVTKEILKLTRYNEEYLSVDVYYEFYNHGEEKEVLVGFEAPSPSGDVDGIPVKGSHPYISKFSVLMNGKSLSYKTAIVNDSIYYKNGNIQAKVESEVIGKDFNTNDPSFYYVYHFNARFKKGSNVIKHKYMFNLSGSVMERYSFDYILTAANRWSNKQIDDFTLIIDMGKEQGFTIGESFYNKYDHWVITGKGIMDSGEKNRYKTFYIEDGFITFYKKNFAPKGELYLSASRNIQYCQNEKFDAKKCLEIPFDITYQEKLLSATDFESYKIVRNLPFARRGYIFKTVYIQEYYENQKWYIPNPDYQPNYEMLLQAEKDWLVNLKNTMTK
ncbi:YARHG domain-containing protein [Aquimarina longa]|uniref:YARHG domain-containing protein n=1 Tax=Aquimarina longa TaxID=1080221 RepID=UPI000781DB58|nr:YARHG domain-containing protein [Aquimarina longa]